MPTPRHDPSSDHQTDHEVALHEAAHAVAHYRFNFSPHAISIIPENNVLGHVSTLDGWNDQETAEHYVVSCLVGYAAAVHAYPDRQELARAGAASDFDTARRILQKLDPSQSLLELEAGYLDRARRFIDESQNWRAIERVADELVQHKRLDMEDIELLIEIADERPGAVSDLVRWRQLRAKRWQYLFIELILAGEDPPDIPDEWRDDISDFQCLHCEAPLDLFDRGNWQGGITFIVTCPACKGRMHGVVNEESGAIIGINFRKA